jgi:hypothetical protein
MLIGGWRVPHFDGIIAFLKKSGGNNVIGFFYSGELLRFLSEKKKICQMEIVCLSAEFLSIWSRVLWLPSVYLHVKNRR